MTGKMENGIEIVNGFVQEPVLASTDDDFSRKEAGGDIPKTMSSQITKRGLNYPPGPRALPIIGHIHLLVGYRQNPWEGFDSFRQQYGDIVSLKLGCTGKTVLISSMSLIKEVLGNKAEMFANRPIFDRYKLIFGGDQENSLALCDWTELQRTRRVIAQNAVIPRKGGCLYKRLSDCIQLEVRQLLTSLAGSDGQPSQVQMNTSMGKSEILTMCFNVFTSYLCSKRFPTDAKWYQKQARDYDFVFYDINQMYITDFLPFLRTLGLFGGYLKEVQDTCESLRHFVDEEIVNERLMKRKTSRNHHCSEDPPPPPPPPGQEPEAVGPPPPEDFLDTLLEHHYANEDTFPWVICIFEIGDLLGGHSAVGNLIMRLIGHLALHPEAQVEIRREADRALKESNGAEITLGHRNSMAYTEAAMLETLRIASSPIVPHVATTDTQLNGYDIEKGTMVMINSYHLNTDTERWKNAKTFDPTNFLSRPNNNNKSAGWQLNKPEHYFPFSWGKRSCLGYKMVSTMTFVTIANLVREFCILVPPSDKGAIADQLQPKGSLALPVDDCFEVLLVPRGDRQDA